MFINGFRLVIHMFQDQKLCKFKVEGISRENILGHLQGGNFEFKMMVLRYRKIFEI